MYGDVTVIGGMFAATPGLRLEVVTTNFAAAGWILLIFFAPSSCSAPSFGSCLADSACHAIRACYGLARSAATSLPAARPKSFPYAYGHVTSPGTVIAEVREAKIGVARTQSVEQEVLRYAEFKALVQIDSGSPGMLDSDRIRRPGV